MRHYITNDIFNTVLETIKLCNPVKCLQATELSGYSPYAVIVILIKTSISNQRPKTNPQRIEDLSGGRHPDIGVCKLAEIWLDVVDDPLGSSREGDATDEQDHQNKIGERCCEVHNLSRRFYSLPQAKIHQYPGED